MSQGIAQFFLFLLGLWVAILGPLCPVDRWPKYARSGIVALGLFFMAPGFWHVFKLAWGI